MPYIIAVLALVVVGVGFTLFQSPDQVTNLSETTSTEVLSDASAPSTQPAETEIKHDEEEDKWDDDDDEHEEEEDDDWQSSQPVVQPTTPQPTTPTTVPTPTVAAFDYKNGTYTSNITFRTPEGNYSMTVTLTISDDKVTTSNISYDSKAARDSYSKRFTSSYESYVTSKDLDSINLSRVGGASLTSNAFNKAVSNIKTQASA